MFSKNRKGLLAIVALLVISISLTACGKSEDGVIAKVNGKDIKLDDFNKEFNIIKEVRKKEYGDDILEKDIEGKPYADVLKEELFNMYVDEEIISQDLERLEIGVTDEEVEEQVKLMKEAYIEQLGGEKEYEDFLTESGFTQDYITTTIRREIMVQKHREDFLNKVHLKDEEVEKFYKENEESLSKLRLSHILVETEEDGKAVLEKLKKEGADFHAIAATDSVDTQTSEKGGDLGFVRKGELEKMGLGELEEPAFKLEEGAHSELIQTGLGFHIVYLEEKLDSLEELKDEVAQRVKYEKYLSKLKELKENADVKILDKKFKF